jgi:prepilin-type N-terminal cleavage/methylation domain-containing protein
LILVLLLKGSALVNGTKSYIFLISLTLYSLFSIIIIDKNNLKFMKTKKGFTLIELLVVIAIIGILATIAVVSLQQARQSARDVKRVADVKQMQTALELYFNYWQLYPSDVLAGGSIASGTDVIFMQVVPTGPSPADGECDSSDYIYSEVDSGARYSIEFCLGSNVGDIPAGVNCAVPGGVISSSSPCI